MQSHGVTVAIPNWNHELLLPRSITSALQTVRVLRERGVPAEVIVVDDCSRDGSLPLLRQLEALHHDEGLRVLARRTNAGLAAARNLALEQARHRYVAFLDADNELLPATMPHFLQAIETTGAAVVYGNLLIRRIANTLANGLLSSESFQPRMFRSNYVDAFALVDRRQVLDCGGYTDYLPTHEDYELWLHLAACGRRLVFVPMVFGYYYRMPNSMVKGANRKLIRARSKRVFDQFGCRKNLPLQTARLRYHPATGYL